jgi:hypothetical protein
MFSYQSRAIYFPTLLSVASSVAPHAHREHFTYLSNRDNRADTLLPRSYTREATGISS